MTRDPESVYRATPDKRLPLFEQVSCGAVNPECGTSSPRIGLADASPAGIQFDSPSSQERGAIVPADAHKSSHGRLWQVPDAVNDCGRGESKQFANSPHDREACGGRVVTPEIGVGREGECAADEQARPKNLIDNALASYALGSRIPSKFACNVAASRGAGFGQGSAPQTSGLNTFPFVGAQCETGASPVSLPAGGRGAAPLKAHARKSDPLTSHEAAKSVRNQSRTKKAIKDVLSLYGPQTDEGIIAALRDKKFSHSGIRTRRREMCDSIPPEVVDSGERRETQSGRNSIAWRLA